MIADPHYDFVARLRHMVISQDKSVRTYNDTGAKALDFSALTFLAIWSRVIRDAKEAAQHGIACKRIGLLLHIFGREDGHDTGADLVHDRAQSW